MISQPAASHFVCIQEITRTTPVAQRSANGFTCLLFDYRLKNRFVRVLIGVTNFEVWARDHSISIGWNV
jgi:hypothetical protein